MLSKVTTGRIVKWHFTLSLSAIKKWCPLLKKLLFNLRLSESQYNHKFITVVLNDIRAKHPNATKCIYFSDGASSQYKNCKNFINLCYHNSDHSLEAESPCDGIQGTVKRLTACGSFRWLLVKWFPLPTKCFNGAKITFLALASFMFLQKTLIIMLTNFNLINVMN